MDADVGQILTTKSIHCNGFIVRSVFIIILHLSKQDWFFNGWNMIACPVSELKRYMVQTSWILKIYEFLVFLDFLMERPYSNLYQVGHSTSPAG